MKVTIKFVDVVGCIATFREYGIDDHPTRTTLHDYLILGLDGHWMIGAKGEVEVENRPLVFMS